MQLGLHSEKYRIASRKLLREKTGREHFAEKTFMNVKLIAQVGSYGMPKISKTFAGGCKIMKFVKVFPSKVSHYTVANSTGWAL